MNEAEVRAAAKAHDELLKIAFDVLKPDASAVTGQPYDRLDATEINLLRVQVSGDLARLIYASDDHNPSPYELRFPAHYLWDPAAVAEARQKAEEARKARAQAAERDKEARERAELERLRQKYG